MNAETTSVKMAPPVLIMLMVIAVLVFPAMSEFIVKQVNSNLSITFLFYPKSFIFMHYVQVR